MVRATVFVYLAWTAALVTPQDDLHYNTIIVDIIRHQELGNGVNLGDIPQSRDQESKVDDDIFADAEFDHEYEAVDKAAANALAPSPQPASVDRKHLNTAEVAKVERLAALAKNTPNAPIAEEDTDDGESNDDDDDDENDDVGDKVDGDEPPASRGNVPAAVDDDKASRGNVPAAVDDDKASRGNVPAAIDDDKAASTLAPSPTMQPDNVDRKHLNTAEVAKVERLAALVKNTANVPIDEEDTDGGERNDDDDDDDDDIDDVGDEVNGDKTPAPRGNATVAVDDAPIHAASVGAASPDHNVSSPTASPSPFGIIGITLGCVATVCAIVGVYRSRRQAATQFSSESTLYMDDIRLRESEVTRY
ncbi:hypothetical protein H257_10059 [Aphanomyces astaci]|uniref:Uncharacterized protein n=1 Tax=Aphanomyces astaci TaxID=112090 RepID=W4G7J0_APHAT|nr:hypothetical protein H257_10059 [Aphanomyces astaci]ETV75667.1 hypothetical protein H257_10059 [Aphanomyces astaci]|eukprot:XP_009834798.1 hypothetical protein H257_10059 [Aphanomyces astaci]